MSELTDEQEAVQREILLQENLWQESPIDFVRRIEAQYVENPTILEAVERARLALTESEALVPHCVINQWLDCIEKAARGGG